MPYFKNNYINLLFIHIPKTGGTSLEEYFSKKYKLPLNNRSLYNFLKPNRFLNMDSSLQHLTYNTIMKYKHIFNIDTNNIKIISIIRDPYNRVVSDLFFLKIIEIGSSQEDVFTALHKYLIDSNDNHNMPQYLFITKDNVLINDIKILHCETLKEDMINLGYKDFNYYENCNSNKVNYDNYLNENSINLINTFYDKDFELLNYCKRTFC